MDGDKDEYSSEDESSRNKKFQLPKRLRGWLFMDRSQIPLKEHSGILNMTQGLTMDKLKKVMTEPYPDKILKDIDGRTTIKTPWQQQRKQSNRKPSIKKKRSYPSNFAEEEDEDPDVYALDEQEDEYSEMMNGRTLTMEKTLKMKMMIPTRLFMLMMMVTSMPIRIPSMPLMSCCHGKTMNSHKL